jgi:cytochrome c biogenesis protein CcdA
MKNKMYKTYKTYKKIICFALFFAIIISTCNVMAVNTEIYNPFSNENGGELTREKAPTLFKMGEKVWGTLRNIALAVAVISLSFIGLKYMFGSVDQKAEYKTTLLPWATGLVLVAFVMVLLDLIQKLTQTLN